LKKSINFRENVYTRAPDPIFDITFYILLYIFGRNIVLILSVDIFIERYKSIAEK